jgi:hypothetical protein
MRSKTIIDLSTVSTNTTGEAQGDIRDLITLASNIFRIYFHISSPFLGYPISSENRVGPKEQELIEKEIQKMLDAGVIRSSMST